MFHRNKKTDEQIKKEKDLKEVKEYNERQEKYDDKIKEAAQKHRFKSILAKMKFETYTKRLVGFIVGIGLIDLQLSYILAFFGMDQIAETLSTQICITILGTALVYMIRAYFDTKSEKKMEYNDKVLKNKTIDVINNTGIDTDVFGNDFELENDEDTDIENNFDLEEDNELDSNEDDESSEDTEIDNNIADDESESNNSNDN